MDYYTILGLTSSATREEIRTAYLELCLKYHPDRNPGMNPVEITEMMKKINRAYEVLYKNTSSGQSSPQISSDFPLFTRFEADVKAVIEKLDEYFNIKDRVGFPVNHVESNIKILRKVGQFATFLSKSDCPTLYAQLISTLNLINELPIRKIKLEQFDENGWYIGSTEMGNLDIRFMNILIHLWGHCDPVDPAFETVINQLTLYIPKKKISDLLNADFQALQTNWFRYARKAFKVTFAKKEKILKWAEDYGLDIQIPKTEASQALTLNPGEQIDINNEDHRSQLVNIFVNYVLD